MRTIPVSHLVYTVASGGGGYQTVHAPREWRQKDAQTAADWLRTLQPPAKSQRPWVLAKKTFAVGDGYYCGVVLRAESFGSDPRRQSGGYLAHALLTPIDRHATEVEELPLVEQAQTIGDRLPDYLGMKPQERLEAYLAEWVEGEDAVPVTGPDTAFLHALGLASLSRILRAAAPPHHRSVPLDLEGDDHFQPPEVIARALGALPPPLRRSVDWGCWVAPNLSLSFVAGVPGPTREPSALSQHMEGYARWLYDHLAAGREDDALAVLQDIHRRSWEDLPQSEGAAGEALPGALPPGAPDRPPTTPAAPSTVPHRSQSLLQESERMTQVKKTTPPKPPNAASKTPPSGWDPAQEEALRLDLRAYVDERFRNLESLLADRDGAGPSPVAGSQTPPVPSASAVREAASQRASAAPSPPPPLGWKAYRPEIYFALLVVLILGLYLAPRGGLGPASPPATSTATTPGTGGGGAKPETAQAGGEETPAGEADGAPAAETAMWPAADFDGQWLALWQRVVAERTDAVVAALTAMQEDSAIWDRLASDVQKRVTPNRIQEVAKGKDAPEAKISEALVCLFEYGMASRGKGQVSKVNLELDKEEYGAVAIDDLLTDLQIPEAFWPAQRATIDNQQKELLAAIVLGMALRDEAAAVAGEGGAPQ